MSFSSPLFDVLFKSQGKKAHLFWVFRFFSLTHNQKIYGFCHFKISRYIFLPNHQKIHLMSMWKMSKQHDERLLLSYRNVATNIYFTSWHFLFALDGVIFSFQTKQNPFALKITFFFFDFDSLHKQISFIIWFLVYFLSISFMVKACSCHMKTIGWSIIQFVIYVKKWIFSVADGSCLTIWLFFLSGNFFNGNIFGPKSVILMRRTRS